MIIRNATLIRTLECPCGWKTTHIYTRESDLKIKERLHAKVCPKGKLERADTVYTVERRTTKI